MQARDSQSWGGTVLWERLRVVGERQLPREYFDKLNGQEWRIWLTEPDPAKFPASMEHLKEYAYLLLEDE